MAVTQATDINALRVRMIGQLCATDDANTLSRISAYMCRVFTKKAKTEEEYISKQDVLAGIRAGLKEYYDAKREGRELPNAWELANEL